MSKGFVQSKIIVLCLSVRLAVVTADDSAVLGQSPSDCAACESNGSASTAACDGCDRSDFDSNAGQDFSFCSWLSGDVSPFRKRMAENGITLTNNLTNFYFGNTRGGVEEEFRFAGHGDYRANFDINKLGGPKGQFLQLRAEHRYGESLAGATGSFLPATLPADLPVADSEQLYLTNFLFTQALSESFAVYAGKLDTLDGDANAFAHGRGISQFSNAAFVVTPIGLRTVAYSTLGTGFVILDEGKPIYNFLALNARDTTESDGLSELFADGVVLSSELRLPTNFRGLPGHQLFGAIWSSRDYASLAQSPLIVLPNVPIAEESGSWALTYNFDQYLTVDPCDSKKGWGVFGRAGIADPNTNPFHYFLSLGLGGNSRLRGNSNDTFGTGWYYSGTSDRIAPFISAIVGDLRDGQGGELFYNFALSKRLFVTADSQVIIPARSSVDTALLFGLRANFVF